MPFSSVKEQIPIAFEGKKTYIKDLSCLQVSFVGFGLLGCFGGGARVLECANKIPGNHGGSRKAVGGTM